MTELKPCPFCGKTYPYVQYVEIKPGYGQIGCSECETWFPSDIAITKEEAIRAWNIRYEPTCIYEIDQLPEGGTVYSTCTNCGWQTDVDYMPMTKGFSYCPNCGAKVVDA